VELANSSITFGWVVCFQWKYMCLF